MCFLEERALQIMQKIQNSEIFESTSWNLGDSAFNIYIQPHNAYFFSSPSPITK